VAIREAIVAQADAEYPNEACGIIIGSDVAASGGQPIQYAPTRNEAASPLRYRVHADDLLRLTIEVDDADQAFWAIVHSHVRSPAVPSLTDIRAAVYPDALYMLVSLSDDEADPLTGERSLRAWRIVEGQVYEVAIEPAGSPEPVS
jgi:proteasome lid subunit RPN8/RPN11